MGLFDGFGDLFIPEAPLCEPCKSERGMDVQMEYREAEYAPQLAATVDAYVCPKCDHKVVAEDASMKDSTAGTAPDDSGGSGRHGVVPMDGDYDDPDDGWRSVR